MPVVDGCKSEEQLDRRPFDNRRVGFPVVNIFDLFVAMNVETRFPLVNLVCLDSTLLFHRPDGWQDDLASGNLRF